MKTFINALLSLGAVVVTVNVFGVNAASCLTLSTIGVAILAGLDRP